MAQSASKGGMGDRQDGEVSSMTTDGKIFVTRTEVQFLPFTKIEHFLVIYTQIQDFWKSCASII